MTTSNTDAADLASQAFGGIIAEDVLNDVFDISRIPLPFLDRISSQRSTNQYKSWLKSKLPQPNVDNAVVDGSDASAPVQNLATRQGNRHQIMEYTIAVSQRARDVDTIGYADELARQIMEYNQAIRRDLNATLLQPQASVEDDGNTTPGRLGGFPSWLTTSTSRGTSGADGGFNYTTGVVDAPTPGDKRGLTETLVRDIADSVYKQGGNPTIMHSGPDVIRGFSLYLFDESARIATLRRDANEMAPAQAIGSVNVFLTDHGVTLEMVSDRLQQPYTANDTGDVFNVFIYDPEYVSVSYLHSPMVMPIGKPGLSDIRQISLDATLVVQNEEAHGLIADIDPTIPVVT